MGRKIAVILAVQEKIKQNFFSQGSSIPDYGLFLIFSSQDIRFLWLTYKSLCLEYNTLHGPMI